MITKREKSQIWEDLTKKIVSARASGLFSLVRKYEQQLLNLDKIEDV